MFATIIRIRCIHMHLLGIRLDLYNIPPSEKSLTIFFLGLESGILSIQWYKFSTSASSKYSSMSTRVSPFNCLRKVIVSISTIVKIHLVNNSSQKKWKYQVNMNVNTQFTIFPYLHWMHMAIIKLPVITGKVSFVVVWLQLYSTAFHFRFDLMRGVLISMEFLLRIIPSSNFSCYNLFSIKILYLLSSLI